MYVSLLLFQICYFLWKMTFEISFDIIAGGDTISTLYHTACWGLPCFFKWLWYVNQIYILSPVLIFKSLMSNRHFYLLWSNYLVPFWYIHLLQTTQVKGPSFISLVNNSILFSLKFLFVPYCCHNSYVIFHKPYVYFEHNADFPYFVLRLYSLLFTFHFCF